MRKILILTVFLLIILLGAGSFFWYRKNREPISVFKEAGSVMYKTGGGAYAPITTSEFNIPNHSFVKTGEDGLAQVVLPDDSMISLSVDTEMQINFDNTGTNVSQTLGSAWFRVQKLLGKEEFRVETSSSVATVRGTIFGVERGEEDVIYVTQNSVEIAQTKEVEGKKVKENVQTLGENKMAKILPVSKGAPEIIEIPEEKKNTAWFRRNQVINEEFEKGKPKEFIKKLPENKDIKKIDQELESLRKSRRTLGSEASDPTAFFQNLRDSAWLENSAEACATYNSQESEQGLRQLEESRSILGKWADWIVEVMKKVKNFCKDGVIDSSEGAEIEKLYKNQPEFNFSLPL